MRDGRMSVSSYSAANSSTSWISRSLGIPMRGFLILRRVNLEKGLKSRSQHLLASEILRQKSNALFSMTLVCEDGSFALWGKVSGRSVNTGCLGSRWCECFGLWTCSTVSLVGLLI